MKKWLMQTSTIGGMISLAITAIQLIQSGGDAFTVSLGVLSAALLLVNDGKFIKGLSGKNSGGLTVVVIIFTCFAIGNSGCAALKQYVTDGDLMDDLKSCSIRCGFEIVQDVISKSCNSQATIENFIWEQIEDKKIKIENQKSDPIMQSQQKSILIDAGMCMLSCMAGKSIDVFSKVCKT